MEFKGYKRADGRYGVRNHVLAVSSVSCANGVVDALGRIFPDIVTVQHAYGCGYGPDDWGTSFKMLSGLANHPNVGAVLAIGLGCELLKAEHLVDAVQGKPAEALVIQQMGSAAATKRGIDIIEGFIRQLAGQQREPAPLGGLLVGLKCGGSDAFSRAKVRTKQLLAEYKRPEMDPAKAQELQSLVEGLARGAGMDQLPVLE